MRGARAEGERMRRVFLIGGAILVVAIFAIGIFYYLGAGKGPAGGGFFARLRSGFSPAVTTPKTPPQMGAPPEFAFHRLEIDTSQRDAQACLVFTRNLDASGRTHYEDYLAVEPKTRIVARALDQRLCIGGLAFHH